uniref:trypsin n=1 Tax=Erpetoichthys calabaricus TaxID=27687 RepID=A0A8C4XC88_ERPCA
MLTPTSESKCGCGNVLYQHVFLTSLSLLCLRGDKIIGGCEARPHSHPYMAFLYIQKGENSEQCGGFLIREDFVLTAAHCDIGNIKVILGAHCITCQEESQQVINVIKRVLHPKYHPLNHDIMLLKLEKNATLNDNVTLLPIPPKYFRIPPGTICSIAGWGATSHFPVKQDGRLLETNVTLLNWDECKDQYGKVFTYKMVCAGNAEHKAYKGDSGGPLVCRGVASGIVSFTSVISGQATVFTDVYTYREWIKKVLDGN